jgi:hypothetical protein
MNETIIEENIDMFIKNAILCWLHHYGDQGHRWDSIYKELAQRDTYINMESNDAKPKPRPARRRKPKTQPD